MLSVHYIEARVVSVRGGLIGFGDEGCAPEQQAVAVISHRAMATFVRNTHDDAGNKSSLSSGARPPGLMRREEG